MINEPIILASGSPRRREILTQVGISFLVKPSNADETINDGLEPSNVVKELAYRKAVDIANQEDGDCIVIGSDTVVAYDDEILGKPADEADAFRMLSQIQGKTHHVYTGVSIIHIQNGVHNVDTFYEDTQVVVCPMSETEIWDYIHTGEPMDKAGAYGIQGAFAAYIQRIHGDYYNVVGLPISKILHRNAFLQITK